MRLVNFSAQQLNRLQAAWWLLNRVLPDRARHTHAIAQHILRDAAACRQPARGCIWSVYGPHVIVMQEDPLRISLAAVSQFLSHEGQHVQVEFDGTLSMVEHDCPPHFCSDAAELEALEAYAQAHVDYIRAEFGEEIGDGVPLVEKILSVAAPVVAGAGLGVLVALGLRSLFGDED